MDGCDWKGLGRGTVVNIGGSIGNACFAIAEVAPKLKFVVQGLEKVAEGVKERVKGHNNLKELNSRRTASLSRSW